MPGKYQIVLIRHGESQWNVDNRFTGWHDVPLSAVGEKESHDAGKALKVAGFSFDVAYTSVLKRAIKTCWNTLEELDLMWIPVNRSWKLNERHYGALQGLNKQDTVAKYGLDQVMVWRRSYSTPPPALDASSEYYPGNDPKYADVPREELPFTESLATTKLRVVPYWNDVIVPSIKAGKKVLIVAHGNSLRALVQHLDNISEDTITGLNIPTGVPLVYDLDENFHPIVHEHAIAPLSGHYVGNQEEIRNRIAGVANQTKA
ncbi:hypothetical protein H257_13674 [Aphanomyces astaci]|uniref:Phosphoglycerate mutase n=1 Tax=Aphanomyces astaci TaxID=112090 RepID=W4FTX9_APHAT|nr:hypothetical protein H257_13674 [Aphanomyces astaci]ETV70922.1 hypothetical protein H257_13674 [Aphanomyces astaci]|eukprot:XP_009839585.1 hypothetical protein H257_13674 [Aphanomyces astaci]